MLLRPGPRAPHRPRPGYAYGTFVLFLALQLAPRTSSTPYPSMAIANFNVQRPALQASPFACGHAPLCLIALLATILGKRPGPQRSHPETALTAPPRLLFMPHSRSKRCQTMGNDIAAHLGSCCEIHVQGPGIRTPDIMAAMAKAAQLLTIFA